MSAAKTIRHALQVAALSPPELVAYAKAEASVQIETNAEAYAWIIGYLHGHLTIAAKQLQNEKLSPGKELTVHWSNGAGYSIYEVVDNKHGQHGFDLVEEVEL